MQRLSIASVYSIFLFLQEVNEVYPNRTIVLIVLPIQHVGAPVLYLTRQSFH